MKYVIDIEDMAVNECNERRYALFKAKNFRTLVFDDVGLSKLTPLADAIGDVISMEREQAYREGFENGEREGYEKAHVECVGKSTRNYNDGYSEGLEDGFKDGKTEGEEELKGIVLDFIKNMVIGRTESKYKPEVKIFDSCEDCVHADKPEWANPCVECKHSHKDMYERG